MLMILEVCILLSVQTNLMHTIPGLLLVDVDYVSFHKIEEK